MCFFDSFSIVSSSVTSIILKDGFLLVVRTFESHFNCVMVGDGVDFRGIVVVLDQDIAFPFKDQVGNSTTCRSMW